MYHDGFIYLGTGLGDGSNNPDNTGIRKFDATTGTQVSDWNVTGVVLPSDLSNSSRAESVEIDPGYVNDFEPFLLISNCGVWARNCVFDAVSPLALRFQIFLAYPLAIVRGGLLQQKCATLLSHLRAIFTYA